MTQAHDTVSIRTAQLCDAEMLARVRVDAWRAAYRGFAPDAYLDQPDLMKMQTKHMHEKLRAIGPEARASVAEISGRIMGYCAFGQVDGDEPEALRGGIYDLYVHPDAWHQGIGRRLMNHATEWLKDAGFSEATLFVFEDNARARAFYESLGWKPDGCRRVDTWFDAVLPTLRYWSRLL